MKRCSYRLEHQKERVPMAIQCNIFPERKNREISVTKAFNNISHSDIITPKIATIQKNVSISTGIS
ncbi:MAG: hypothetical protein PVF58_03775 [Candidatus Methanofastidiosia archaeon]|jgi:hypothetical protein